VCRNLVCSGAEPIGITDCLNFGNPERPDVMDTFARAVDGLAAACKALDVPIVSGNVSLYNETDGRAILPTPTVAAVGLFASPEDVVTQHFKGKGDVVLLLGPLEARVRDLGGSEYLCRTVKGKSPARVHDAVPLIELAKEVQLQKLVLELARAHLLRSAHDVSDGGLAVALVECCTTGPDPDADVGARIDLDAPATPVEATALLFGEAPTRVVVSVSRDVLDRVFARAKELEVAVRELGVTGGDSLSIALVPRHGDVAHTGAMVAGVRELRDARERCLEGIVGSG
jgi:phosphoribosylformylglycinamidine (FGAM) synthase-like enzyme